MAGKLPLGPIEKIDVVRTRWLAAVLDSAFVPASTRVCVIFAEHSRTGCVVGPDLEVNKPGWRSNIATTGIDAAVVRSHRYVHSTLAVERSAIVGITWRRSSIGNVEGSILEGFDMSTSSRPHYDSINCTRGPFLG